jgi:hypothetical protein
MDKTTSAIMATLCLTGATSVVAESCEPAVVDYLSHVEARIVPEIMRVFARVDANRDGQLGWADAREAVRQLQS